MENSIFKFSAIGLLVVFSMSGCQTVSDELAENAVEKMVESATGGDVKMDINGGKVNFNTKDGSMEMTTNSEGGTLQVTGTDGATNIGLAGTRPASAPADLPSFDGAANYVWAGTEGSGMLSFDVSGSDLNTVCAKEMELLTGAGWVKTEKVTVDTAENLARSLAKEGFQLSLNCTVSAEGKVSVSMFKTEVK